MNKTIFILGLLLFINSCTLSPYKCVESEEIGRHKICEDANGVHILFFDEKYLMQDVPLLALFYLKATQVLPASDNYTVGVLAKNYKDSIFSIKSDIHLLQDLSKIKDTFLFQAGTKYILDNFQVEDFADYNNYLKKNNESIKYFDDSKIRFAKFFLYCFLEKENLNLKKFRYHLLLTIIQDVELVWIARKKNKDYSNITKRRIEMSKKLYSIVDPKYDLEGFLLKLEKDLEKRDLK